MPNSADLFLDETQPAMFDCSPAPTVVATKTISALFPLFLYSSRTARVKLIPGEFLNTEFNDEKLRNIKIVLINALCSKSGVANPVSFVVTEGEGKLADFSEIYQLNSHYYVALCFVTNYQTSGGYTSDGIKLLCNNTNY
jgi:hypothetical protein